MERDDNRKADCENHSSSSTVRGRGNRLVDLFPPSHLPAFSRCLAFSVFHLSLSRRTVVVIETGSGVSDLVGPERSCFPT